MTAPNLQPTLEGTLVTLRPLQPQDWRPLFAVASDPLIWQLHPEPTRYQESVFRRFFDSGIETGSAFAILGRDSGRIIGSSRYFGHDPQRREIEIGWTFLERACWGGGYNREVKRLMLQYAFGFADTVVFWVGEHNLRSRRAMQKLGGVLREGVHERLDARQVIFEIRKGHIFP